MPEEEGPQHTVSFLLWLRLADSVEIEDMVFWPFPTMKDRFGSQGNFGDKLREARRKASSERLRPNPTGEGGQNMGSIKGKFVIPVFLLTAVLLHPALQEKIAAEEMNRQKIKTGASAATCAELGNEARILFDKASGKNPKEAKHWKEEIELADKRCKAENERQAIVIFNEVLAEMKRELQKK